MNILNWWKDFKYHSAIRWSYYKAQRLIKKGYYDENYKPLKCRKCGSTEIDEVVLDTVSYHVCEMDIVCARCGNHLNFWAYGYYQPLYI